LFRLSPLLSGESHRKDPFPFPWIERPSRCSRRVPQDQSALPPLRPPFFSFRTGPPASLSCQRSTSGNRHPRQEFKPVAVHFPPLLQRPQPSYRSLSSCPFQGASSPRPVRTLVNRVLRNVLPERSPRDKRDNSYSFSWVGQPSHGVHLFRRPFPA